MPSSTETQVRFGVALSPTTQLWSAVSRCVCVGHRGEALPNRPPGQFYRMDGPELGLFVVHAGVDLGKWCRTAQTGLSCESGCCPRGSTTPGG